MARELKRLLRACFCIVALSVSACGQNDARYETTDTDLARKDWDVEGVTGVSTPDVPQLARFDIDALRLPLHIYDYYASLCQPPCPGWVENYIVEKEISACDPYGVWRYRYEYTQMQGMMGVTSVKLCHFQLPRDSEGNIVSGQIECRGVSTDGFTSVSAYFSTTLDFSRRPLSINGKPLHVSVGLLCDWGSEQNWPSYPAQCLADSDCGAERICDFDSFTCMDDCNFAPCPDNHACNPATGHCIACEEECPEGFYCGMSPISLEGEVACLNNCQEASCSPGLICQFNFDTQSCSMMLHQMQSAEGCDPACPEGFECMSYTPGGGGYLFCANYCETPGCPEDGYMCSYTEGECRVLVHDYNS